VSKIRAAEESVPTARSQWSSVPRAGNFSTPNPQPGNQVLPNPRAPFVPFGGDESECIRYQERRLNESTDACHQPSRLDHLVHFRPQIYLARDANTNLYN